MMGCASDRLGLGLMRVQQARGCARDWGCRGTGWDWGAATRAILHKFPGRDQGNASSALGLTIEQDPASEFIRISQETLIQAATQRYNIGQGPCKTPLPPGAALTSTTCLPLSEEEASVYRSMVGALQYCATMTRPDLCLRGQRAQPKESD
jgi:hypothetical protein